MEVLAVVATLLLAPFALAVAGQADAGTAGGLTYKTIFLNRTAVSDGSTLSNFTYVDEGTGPSTVLLLHGFPDSANVWRNQVPALVDAGYRVIAPDLRGFGSSPKPQNVSDYEFTQLVSDVVTLLFYLRVDPSTPLSAVIAHDYGTSLGTFLTALNGLIPQIPFKTESYIMMSTGHLNLTAKYANINDNVVRQRQLAWYCLYFQAEGVAERGVSANDFEWYRKVFAPTTPTFIVEEHIENLGKSVGNNSLGSLTSAFNWYRSFDTGVSADKFDIPHSVPVNETIPIIQVPTLGIWGTNDAYITKEWMQASARFVAPGKYTFKTVNSGHWIPLEAPFTLNNMILDFIPKSKKS